MEQLPRSWPKLPAPSDSTEQKLAWLHTLEFAQGSRFAWPWTRWREGKPDHRTLFKTIADPLFSGEPALEAAKALRLPELAGVSSPPTTDINIATEPHTALEACMLAFAETRFADVETLAEGLMTAILDIDSALFSEAPQHLPATYSLLLEAWWFAVYRQGMPTYVKDPDALLARLKGGSLKWIETGGDMVAESTLALLTANHLAMQGHVEAAIEAYQQTLSVTGFKGPVMPQAHVMFEPKSAITKSIDWYAHRSHVKHHFIHEPASEHAILVSCDSRYLRNYGEVFAGLVAKRLPGMVLHLHLINCDDEDVTFVAHIAEMHGIKVNYSIETNGFMETAPYRVADVTSAARYVYLPAYLAHYKSITVSDMDGWPGTSAEALTSFGDTDVLISSWIWRKNKGRWRLPWSNVSAALLSVQATTGGMAFAEAVSRYIQHAFWLGNQRGVSSYFADQAALFLCLRELEDDGTVDIDFIGGGFQQSSDNGFHTRHASKKAAMVKELNQSN